VKKCSEFVVGRLIVGITIIAPIYLVCLLLLKTADAMADLLRPLTKLVPAWLPGERILSLLLVLALCFVIGLAARAPAGRAMLEKIEKALFDRIPGYALFRSLTQRVAGETQDNTWKPALAEIEDALVPAFIIEELEDGLFTVFVPSVPTPLAGAVYILAANRVHPLDIPFTRAISTVARWGSGSKDLVAAMKRGTHPRAA
jgi:uncharacterized membrane protein